MHVGRHASGTDCVVFSLKDGNDQDVTGNHQYGNVWKLCTRQLRDDSLATCYYVARVQRCNDRYQQSRAMNFTGILCPFASKLMCPDEAIIACRYHRYYLFLSSPISYRFPSIDLTRYRGRCLRPQRIWWYCCGASRYVYLHTAEAAAYIVGKWERSSNRLICRSQFVVVFLLTYFILIFKFFLL